MKTQCAFTTNASATNYPQQNATAQYTESWCVRTRTTCICNKNDPAPQSGTRTWQQEAWSQHQSQLRGGTTPRLAAPMLSEQESSLQSRQHQGAMHEHHQPSPLLIQMYVVLCTAELGSRHVPTHQAPVQTHKQACRCLRQMCHWRAPPAAACRPPHAVLHASTPRLQRKRAGGKVATGIIYLR